MGADAVQTCVEVGPVQRGLFSRARVRASLLAQGVFSLQGASCSNS